MMPDVALSLGGTVSAEHGIGLTKRRELIKMTSGVEMDLMQAVRQAWDPAQVFNNDTIMVTERCIG